MFSVKPLFLVFFAICYFCGAGALARAQQPATVNPTRATAITLYSQKRFPEAVAALQALVKQDDKDVIAWYYLGLAFESMGQTENALKPFEHAAKIDPAEYFADAKAEDRGKFEDRLVEIRPTIVAAANSAVHYQALNRSLSDKQKQEWADRLADLYDYATLLTSKEITKPAKITELPPPPVLDKQNPNHLSGDLSMLLMLRADGSVKRVATYGFVPRELQKSLYQRAANIKFDPAQKDGKPVGQLMLINYKQLSRSSKS